MMSQQLPPHRKRFENAIIAQLSLTNAMPKLWYGGAERGALRGSSKVKLVKVDFYPASPTSFTLYRLIIHHV